MKKILFILIALGTSVITTAQVSNKSALDSIKAQFEKERDITFEEFEEEAEKARKEYEEYEKKLRAEYEEYVNSIKQTWGKDNVADDTRSKWVEYSNDYKSRSIVDFENGDITVEVALDDVDENDSEEINRRLTEAIKKMLDSKGNSEPYNNKVKGNNLTKEPILNGLVDLSMYHIEKGNEPQTTPSNKNKRKTPPTPTVRGGKQQLANNSNTSEKNQTVKQEDDATGVSERQEEIENKKREEEEKRANELKKRQEEAKLRAEERKKQGEERAIAEEKRRKEEKAKQQAEEKKRQEEEKAKKQAEEKKRKEEEKAKKQAEEKKKKEEEEKAKQQAKEKKNASTNDIAKAVATQSEKTITTIKGEDNKERKVVKVQMALVSDNLSKNASLYKDYVSKNSNNFSIEEPLIFAVIEQESSFNPEAKSWVPAYGLMQLVPKSGGVDAYKYVYKREWIPTMSYLYVPHQNIELGTAYLRILMNQFKNVTDPDCRRLCAIAGYNTGAGNVCRAFTGKTVIKGAVEMINKMSYDELYDHLTKKLSTDEARKYVSGVSKRREKYLKTK